MAPAILSRQPASTRKCCPSRCLAMSRKSVAATEKGHVGLPLLTIKSRHLYLRSGLTARRASVSVGNSGCTHEDSLCRLRRPAIFEDRRACRRRRSSPQGACRVRSRGGRRFAALPWHEGVYHRAPQLDDFPWRQAAIPGYRRRGGNRRRPLFLRGGPRLF